MPFTPGPHYITNRRSGIGDCPTCGAGVPVTKQGHCRTRVNETKRKRFAAKEKTYEYRSANGETITLTAAEREDMITEAGQCALCESSDKRLVLDHCHTNGHIRGVLCSPCNVAVGIFEDNVTLLQKAIDYLGKGPLPDEYIPHHKTLARRRRR